MTCMKHEIVQQIINTEVQDPNIEVQNIKKLRSSYINEDLGIAVDDRYHSEVVHVVKGTPIRNFKRVH